MQLKGGDRIVVKVTRYIAHTNAVVPQITPESPVWLSGYYQPEAFDYNIEGEKFICGPEIPKKTMVDLEWDGDYGLMASVGDKWKIIPENQWPDEVCVALAKRALLGEPESE